MLTLKNKLKFIIYIEGLMLNFIAAI